MLFGPEYTKTTNGVVRTKSLFYELTYTDTTYAVFTLKDKDLEKDGKTYVSLPNLFRSLVPQDPTEYTFAQAVFGNWQIWEVIREAPQIKPYVTKLRREAEVKIKSEAIRAIAEEMNSGGRSSFTAAKLLLERGWIEKEAASKSKQKLLDKEEADMNKEAIKLLSEDADRLGIKIQ